MVHLGPDLKSNTPKAYGHSLFAALGVVTAGILFYAVVASGIDHDLLAVGAVWMILLVSLKDHRYLIIGWFLAAPYFPYGIKGQPNFALNISHNLFVPFMTLVTLGSSLLRGRRLAWGKENLFLLAFVAYAVFSAFYTSGGRYEDLRAIYAIYALPFLLYTTARNLKIDGHFVTVLGYACLFHLTTLSVMAYYEYTTGLSLYTRVLRWADVGMGRVAGPFGSPIILGVFVSVLSLSLYLGYRLGLISRLVFGFTVLFSGALYVLTFTRSVWLGVVTSTVYVTLKVPGKALSRAVTLLGLVVVMSVLTTYMLSKPDLANRLSNPSTGSARVAIAYASLKLIAQSPIVGAGFGSFDDLIPKYLPQYMLGVRVGEDTSHMTLLTVMAELGAPGVLLLLAFMFGALSKPRTAKESKAVCSDNRLLITVNTGFILAFAVNAFLIDMRFFSIAYSWLFISLGMIHNVRRAESSLLE